MSQPLVSVLTPTFNHGGFIRECIASVLAQTDARWEQIIIDDGSTDDTAGIVGAFRDLRIRYFRQEHHGVFRLAETYNRALAAAGGELVALLEGDDFWPVGKLATLVPAFADPEVVMAFGQTVITTADGTTTRSTIPTQTFIRKFGEAPLLNTPVGAATKAMYYWPGHNYTFPCSVVIRRRALEAIGGFQSVEGVPFVDYPTFLALSLAGRYFYTPAVMGFWRRHPGSVTALKYQDVTEMRLLAFMRQFLEQNRARINLTRDEEVAVMDALEDWDHRIAAYHGLTALNHGHWRDARRRFRLARRSRQPLFRFAGLVGTVASILHIKLGWFVAIGGRLFDRQVHWTGVQRRLSSGVGSDRGPA